MIKIGAIIAAVLVVGSLFSCAATAPFRFAVVGDGVAGIAVLGVLRDIGIPAESILWVGPEFNAGRLSQYPHVPANSTMQSFIDFINSCKTFSAINSSILDSLSQYDPKKEYTLSVIVEALRDITIALRAQVNSVQGCLKSLDFVDGKWCLNVDGKFFVAERVVLATGSHPRSLNYSCDAEIPLEVALDKARLAVTVKPEDGVAVVGSAHSAVLIMKFLSEIGVARIVNLYNRPIQYAVDTGSSVLHAQYGLRGMAAEWARNVLEKNPPANLVRFFNTEDARATWLPLCNKIVYAIGFERNELPPINGSQQTLGYDASSGIIAPHLFGIGIAFPEAYTAPDGAIENRVGLNSFMAYAQRIMPEWMNKDLQTRFAAFDALFTISLW